MPQFSCIIVTNIARSLNSKVDALAGITAAMALPERNHYKILVKERLLMPDLGTWEAIADYIANNPLVAKVGVLPAGEDWRQPFIRFMKYEILPEDMKERVSIRRSSPRLYFNEAPWLLYYRLHEGKEK
ncbi:hypothetical protein MRB53_010258 [Persea americana]|uniref:Uncharacterized protein n=1 Tax=Persea americana TaxID=3435 RepID=A0ACC2LSI3_PERAE|nr:hypothetical protein MRB53_010258 [Persea americana]